MSDDSTAQPEVEGSTGASNPADSLAHPPGVLAERYPMVSDFTFTLDEYWGQAGLQPAANGTVCAACPACRSKSLPDEESHRRYPLVITRQSGTAWKLTRSCGCSEEEILSELGRNGSEEVEGGVSPDNRSTVQQLWAHCSSIAEGPSILERFEYELSSVGLVGEGRCAKLVYLCTTSRLTEQPVSIAVKGPSSGGKSFVVKSTLSFFPHQAFHSLTASSSKAQVYSKEPLKNRMLVLYEYAGSQANPDSDQDLFIRTLLSEGRIRYETVDSTKDGLKGRLIEREGPTGLIVTTTSTSLHPENETRLISVTVKDTPEQTKRVMLAQAVDPAGGIDLLPWEAFQDWLWESERREFAIHYASWLAENIPPAAT